MVERRLREDDLAADRCEAFAILSAEYAMMMLSKTACFVVKGMRSRNGFCLGKS